MTEEPKKILIVEDEAPASKILSDVLAREGFKVIETRNGEEGLDAALREYPAVIILDILMPGMDGLTVARKLREDEWGALVPIVLLTNVGTSQQEAEEIDSDIIYLVKTEWKLEKVVQVVKEIIEVEGYFPRGDRKPGDVMDKVKKRLGLQNSSA
ncbi:response regulator [Patescibacteria group bacterium]|nr:response regulator [Patescibacteria group bacterium]MBU1867954.1 response regulator [Patescibacteria group bacterium]